MVMVTRNHKRSFERSQAAEETTPLIFDSDMQIQTLHISQLHSATISSPTCLDTRLALFEISLRTWHLISDERNLLPYCVLAMLCNEDEFPQRFFLEDPIIERRYTTDDFSDVFESTDDIEFPHIGDGRAGAAPELSDVNRMHSAHSTAGYREGLTAMKNKTVQAGFDEGFNLGAEIGLRIGRAVGIFESLVRLLNLSSSQPARATGDQSDEITDSSIQRWQVLAKESLKTETVFGEKYWGSDGIWKYDVTDEEGDLTWTSIVNSHPLVKFWENLVQEITYKFNVSLEELPPEDDKKHDVGKEANQPDRTRADLQPTQRAEIEF